jgi:hypothetical protein
MNARHSEVLIPNELKITDNLRKIAVRSQAEKETLLYMLGPDYQVKYSKAIYVVPNLFQNNWLYVNKVSIVNSVICIEWHQCPDSTKCKNKYLLKITATNSAITRQLDKIEWYPDNATLNINVPAEMRGTAFEFNISINDINIYSNILRDDV